LTAAGRTLRQAVIVKMDPRVRTPVADLALQYKLSKSLDDAMRELSEARRIVRQRQAAAAGDLTTRLQTVAVELQEAYAPMPGLFSTIQEADVRPTAASDAAANAALEKSRAALAAYQELGR
jgi:hypothetical protein